MNLDELHKVMKGDMTVDQACEGITDDFEIGHVSHRADGDYRKVAQGKWVPVKAGGQGQMAEKKAYEENKKLTDFYDRTGIRNPNEALARNMVEKEESKQENLKAGNRDDSMFKENDSVEFNRYGNTLKGKIERVDKKWNGEVRLLVKAEDGKSYWTETGDITKHPASEKPAEKEKTGNAPQFKMGDKVRVKKEWLNPGESQMTYVIANEPDSSAAIISPEKWDKPLRPKETVRWDMLERVPENEPAPEEKPAPAEPKAEGGGEKANPYKRAQDDFMSRLSIYSNKIKDPSKVSVKRTPQGNWQAYYNGSFLGTFGGNTLDPEAAEELGWWERPAPDFDDEQGSSYEGDNDDLEEASNELKERREQMYNNERYGVNQLEDAAAPARLTRDTKIRLSRIKREQTQDERRTYKIGEISEKTGLQKTANGWREVKKGASPAGGKKTYEGSGSTKGHKWEAEKVGDKYISTHTWPDGRTDKTEITQKDYETMRTTQGGKSEAPKPASSKPSSELKYYEDMGDRVEELRSQMTTAGPEEKRRLIRESVDLQRRMQTAPFRPKKKK